MAQLFDGKTIAAQIQEELKPRIAGMAKPPGIAVVLVGNHAGSEIYVRNKIRTCAELGIRHFKWTPPETVTTAQMLDLIARLNADPEVDAILVQMPLPGEVDDQRVLLAIDPAKDADGFHPENAGRLAANLPGPRPCTPAGVMEMLRRESIDVKGMNAVVVGRSDIVGKPMAMMLLHANATVTVCHSKTRDLDRVCRSADLLVAAMGRPAFLTREFLKPGAVVVDVGINRLTASAQAERLLEEAPDKLRQLREKGSVIVGDVHPGHAMELASRFTPVPGGVGPLTIAMLMVNTVGLAERRRT